MAGNRKIQVGKTHKFTVSHPDYFSKEIELILHNPETVSEVVKLEPRPSTLTYNVYPSHAKIFVDGREMAPYKGKFDVEPGKKTITISANGYFTHEEEVYAGTNREYPLKVIHLKYDDQNIPVSDKGFAVRWELNPFGLYGKVGYGLLLPIALHLEYKYFSLGVGYNGSTYEKKNTKTYDNYDVSIEDLYATARIMTPTLNDMKFFISGTYGQYHHQAKDELAENEFSYTKSYQGVGGGIRYYITPKWSLHTEYFKINTIHLQTNIKKKEDRIIMGLAYEF